MLIETDEFVGGKGQLTTCKTKDSKPTWQYLCVPIGFRYSFLLLVTYFTLDALVSLRLTWKVTPKNLICICDFCQKVLCRLPTLQPIHTTANAVRMYSVSEKVDTSVPEMYAILWHFVNDQNHKAVCIRILFHHHYGWNHIVCQTMARCSCINTSILILLHSDNSASKDEGRS